MGNSPLSELALLGYHCQRCCSDSKEEDGTVSGVLRKCDEEEVEKVCGGRMVYKEGTYDYIQPGEGKYSDEEEDSLGCYKEGTGSKEVIPDGDYRDAHYDMAEETCNNRVVSDGQGICGADLLSWASNPFHEVFAHGARSQICDAHGHETYDVDHALDDNLERHLLLVTRSCCDVDCRPGGDAPDGSYEALVDSRHTSRHCIEDNDCERDDLRNWMFLSSAFIPPESTEGRVHEVLF